jgi:mono/diheme cytochrome c family protein
MAQVQLLGLYQQVDPAAESVNQLHHLSVADERITVLSGAPIRSEMLSRPRPRRRVGKIALFGALFGVALALFLSVGIFLLYPLRQGGQPVVPIPPTLIVLFEVTMLGTMWSTFFAMLGENRFPVFKRRVYDPRISDGLIGIAVEIGEEQEGDVRRIFNSTGAIDIVTHLPDEKTDPQHRLFWWGVFASLVGMGVVVLLLAYNVLRIPFPTQMANQESVAYLEGPRRAAPADSVPIQGPVLVDGQPYTTPPPSSAAAIDNGQKLFSIVCAVCHGKNGDGKSPVAAFFTAHHPADLTGSPVQNLSDQQIYLVITNGFGDMPSMAENLGRDERWDVIQYLRTLKK